jgi:hypothetical protein
VPPPETITLERRIVTAAAILGICLVIGLTAFGALIGRSLYQARAAERYVTVKGLSEREVPADLVLWPIVYSVTGDDLAELQARVEEDGDTTDGGRCLHGQSRCTAGCRAVRAG